MLTNRQGCADCRAVFWMVCNGCKWKEDKSLHDCLFVDHSIPVHPPISRSRVLLGFWKKNRLNVKIGTKRTVHCARCYFFDSTLRPFFPSPRVTIVTVTYNDRSKTFLSKEPSGAEERMLLNVTADQMSHFNPVVGIETQARPVDCSPQARVSWPLFIPNVTSSL